MRCFSIFALFFCIVSLVAAVPIPVLDKGKGRAVDPPSQPPSPPSSRPHTPTPEQDPSVPLPGRTGIHTDTKTGVVTLHYGDDKLPEHMGHVQRNQAEFPHNRQPNPLAGPSEKNRAHALQNIPTAGKHPVTKEPRVRDEKSLNMLHNPHHSTSTTVEYLPRKESNKEGGYTKNFKAAIEKAGPNAQGQIRPNPGWLPLHPDQRRGHEAPARLNTQTQADGSPFKRPGPKDAEKVTKDTKDKITPAPKGPNNLRPGFVSPPGHVWHPSTGTGPSHVNAPGHLSEAEKRQPPRPQNHQHYMQKLQETRAEEAKHKATVSDVKKGPAKYQPAQTDNLRRFNEQHPPRPNSGAGRAQEAPARMQTPPKKPSSNSAPPSRPPSPGPSKKH